MKSLTLVCLLVVVGRGRARPESTTTAAAANATEEEVEPLGRILYTGSQLWKTRGVTGDKVKVLAALRDENGNTRGR
jgi:hypothetical protein